MLITQGAEAIITRTDEGIQKERPKKRYRHPQLDGELRTTRTRHEARILQRAKTANIPVPQVRQLNDTTLILEEIKGTQLKEVLDADPSLAHQAGRLLGKLHAQHIIHGDLTTSNIMHHEGNLTLIDFGLSYHSARDEDMAVDLHLFKQSLESKHHKVRSTAYRHFLQGYRDTGTEAPIERLKKVEGRGRNKGS
jgi:Kae1-associated kinase Bud32